MFTSFSKTWEWNSGKLAMLYYLTSMWWLGRKPRTAIGMILTPWGWATDGGWIGLGLYMACRKQTLSSQKERIGLFGQRQPHGITPPKQGFTPLWKLMLSALKASGGFLFGSWKPLTNRASLFGLFCATRSPLIAIWKNATSMGRLDVAFATPPPKTHTISSFTVPSLLKFDTPLHTGKIFPANGLAGTFRSLGDLVVQNSKLETK